MKKVKGKDVFTIKKGILNSIYYIKILSILLLGWVGINGLSIYFLYEYIPFYVFIICAVTFIFSDIYDNYWKGAYKKLD